ncbi:MAG: ferritin-like domain-containing protein [Gemmataceae bacterium]|nr:ferritin-like domain-containing protein [Gemmataceae bacterium]
MLVEWIRKRFDKTGPDADLPAVLTSAGWQAYFHANAQILREIPWAHGLGITPAELAEIVDSLRAWQFGETSDGAHLLKAAGKYAEQIGDPDLVGAVEAFIAEEQRHGATLGQYLDRAGVPRKQADWGDTLFRACRYWLPNMETWTTPVIMVETHALIFYNAMRLATDCPVLRQICTQILADEIPHIRFQCERLAHILHDRPRWLYTLTILLHRIFFTGITLAIWLGHRRALKAGGYGFGCFWRTAWMKMHWAWRLMAPAGYQWQDETALTPAAATIEA